MCSIRWCCIKILFTLCISEIFIVQLIGLKVICYIGCAESKTYIEGNKLVWDNLRFLGVFCSVVFGMSFIRHGLSQKV